MYKNLTKQQTVNKKQIKKAKKKQKHKKNNNVYKLLIYQHAY